MQEKITAMLKKLHAWFETHVRPRLQWLLMHFMTWVRSFNRNDPEVEFYPAALEVLETPPSPIGEGGV